MRSCPIRREFESGKDTARDQALSRALSRVAADDRLHFIEGDGSYNVGSRAIKSPRRAIFQHEWGRVVECFCHGDLNGNNIITNADISRFGLIDFADAGRNHVFRDFVSFESSVRLDWPEDDDELAILFDELIEAERALYLIDPSKLPASPTYLERALAVRKAAFEKFNSVPRAHYAVLMVLHHWKVNAVGSWSTVQERRAMAAIVAGLEELSSSST